jgi:hypothetical protein
VLAATVLSALGSSAAAYGAELGPWGSALLVAAAVGLNPALVIGVFRITISRSTPIHQLLPRAITAAVIWQLLLSRYSLTPSERRQRLAFIQSNMGASTSSVAWVPA